MLGLGAVQRREVCFLLCIKFLIWQYVFDSSENLFHREAGKVASLHRMDSMQIVSAQAVVKKLPPLTI